jgi:cytosine/uracil/thiamine/allantoin permease
VVQVSATTHDPINDNLTRPVNEPGDSMETDFILATLFNLSVNIIFTLIALLVGVGALRVIDQYLLKSVDIEKELKANNLAVAIFASTVLIFVALIVSFGLKG